MKLNTDRKLHVLVMTPAWQSALACIQSFGRKGHTVSVAAPEDLHPNCASIFVKNYFPLLAKGVEDRAIELNRLTHERKIDLVVPISDYDASVVAKAKELEPDLNKYVISSLDTIEIARSRNRTAELCNALDIRIPKSRTVTQENAAQEADELGYPHILKISNTVASQGVFKISDKTALIKLLATIPASAELQIQEFIVGDFYDITGYADRGRLIESFAFMADYQFSHGGNPPYSVEVNDDKLTVILTKLVKALNWSGGIDIDLLQDMEGNYYVLEINPRLSGTAVFPLKLGIDLPQCYIDTITGNSKRSVKPPAPQSPRRFVSLQAENVHLKRAGIEGRKYARHIRRDDLYYDDGFWDDWRYSAALFDVTRDFLLR